jgi:Putative Ig domain
MLPRSSGYLTSFEGKTVATLLFAAMFFLASCGSPGGSLFDNNTPKPLPLAPAISAVSPSTGPITGGTTVRVNGTNFEQGSTVTFGGVPASSVALVSIRPLGTLSPRNPRMSPGSDSTISVAIPTSTQIVAVTPQGIMGPVTVEVMNPDGQAGGLTNGYTYTASSSSPDPSSSAVPSPDSIQIISSLPDGNPQVPYHATLVAYRGVRSLSNIVTMGDWRLTAGSLPSGLTLDSSTGVIHGTPTATGPATFSVQGTSSGGQTATSTLTINVKAPTSNDPELPRTFLDTTYPDTTGYIVKTVCAAGCDYKTVQSAVSGVHTIGGDANGEIIKLASGATFNENVTLPAYTMVPGKWIIITTDTSAENLPAEGQRINPTYSPVMAKIVTSNVSYAVGAASQANHYWLMGLEIEAASIATTNYGIVAIGCASGSCETSTATLPSYIYLDRDYIHGNNLSSNIKRGVAANGASIAVVNSYISAITNTGQDCQAIGLWNGPGPLKIVNNYLEAATENFMSGGSSTSVTNLITSDIEFRRNYLFKPPTWNPKSPNYGGVTQDVKNFFELKSANRVLVEGNVMENNWVSAQAGMGVLFTPRNSDGGCPQCVVSNVTFQYNLVENSPGGLNIMGGDNIHPSGITNHLTIKNNLLLNIGLDTWGQARPLYQLLNSTAGPANIVINHNTAFESRNVIMFGDSPNTNYVTPFTFTNNIQPHGTYGIMGSGQAIGTGSLDAYCGTSGYTVTANVLETADGHTGVYPSGNYFPTDWSGVFVNYDQGDYHIKTGSKYKNAGTDGKDLGADIDAVVSAIAGSAP